MNKVYTGIGSRETPAEILQAMFHIGAWLAEHGFTLRSGAAPGADTAFEQGCDSVGGQAEIFVPWQSFGNSKHKIVPSFGRNMELAKQVHPAWGRCSSAAQKLHARNINQLFGLELDSPSDFVICWTPNGEPVGGSATVINCAKTNNIPVFNLAVMTPHEVGVAIVNLYKQA